MHRPYTMFVDMPEHVEKPVLSPAVSVLVCYVRVQHSSKTYTPVGQRVYRKTIILMHQCTGWESQCKSVRFWAVTVGQCTLVWRVLTVYRPSTNEWSNLGDIQLGSYAYSSDLCVTTMFPLGVLVIWISITPSLTGTYLYYFFSPQLQRSFRGSPQT